MSKNKNFFYLQYNKINWKNQEKTKINLFINEYIINNIILKHDKSSLSLFDMGFGVGFFIKTFLKKISPVFKEVNIEGCEPSEVNYSHFAKSKPKEVGRIFPAGFIETKTKSKFDFITSIYVFPHFLTEDLEKVTAKIKSMLKEQGKFILVLANEKYLKNKLANHKDLFIESSRLNWNNKTYYEVLHYSDIPNIGKVIDYNREERFYLDLFKSTGFHLEKQTSLDDNGFICTLFVFTKNK